MSGRRFILALTGASGAAYGRRLLQVLTDRGFEVHLSVSEGARQVIAHELMAEMDLSSRESVLSALLGRSPPNVEVHFYRDLAAPIASGSFRTDGMAVVPCSMGTLGRIASGTSSTLIDRAADVCLKERRRLVLVPRETPLSQIHLENMLRVTRAGAIVLPASPGFYGKHASVSDLVDFVVGRVLDHLGVEHDLTWRYGEGVAAAPDEEISRWE